MPAGIYGDDSLFSVRETPWHGLGAVLKKNPNSIEEAIKAAGLDWEVKQLPVYALTNADEIEAAPEEERDDIGLIVDPVDGYFVNVRSDTNKPLGIVSARYQPVQNVQAFSFLASIFGSEMHFETAGSLMNGRRVWVLMKIPTFIEVGGDPIGQYAFVSNSHDGKSSVLAAMTPVRIVCSNTEGAAIRLAKGANAQRTYTVRHVGNMDQKIEEARNVLDVTINYYKQFKEIGDKLALKNVGKVGQQKFVEGLLPIDPDMKERAAANREEARQVILSVFSGNGPDGDTSGNAGASSGPSTTRTA
jgi:phage/plasmid-like protein (TIGR03299 family)